jgi:hypothetical protein
MGTKVRPGTRTVIGAVYYPSAAMRAEEIGAAAAEFMAGLTRGGGSGGKLFLREGGTGVIVL